MKITVAIEKPFLEFMKQQTDKNQQQQKKQNKISDFAYINAQKTTKIVEENAPKNKRESVLKQPDNNNFFEELVGNSEIDYNVFNALNLTNPALGFAYRSHGYNPYECQFNFSDEFAERLMQISKNKDCVSSEKFLDRSNKEVSELFEMALANTNSLIAGMQMMKPKPEDFPRFQDFIIFLKNRAELLSQAIKLLKNINQDSFRLYQDLVALNLEYSEIIKDTFFDRFNRDLVIMNFLEFFSLGKKKKTLAQQKEEEFLARIFLQNLSNLHKNSQQSAQYLPESKKILPQFKQTITKNKSDPSKNIKNYDNFNTHEIKAEISIPKKAVSPQPKEPPNIKIKALNKEQELNPDVQIKAENLAQKEQQEFDLTPKIQDSASRLIQQQQQQQQQQPMHEQTNQQQVNTLPQKQQGVLIEEKPTKQFNSSTAQIPATQTRKDDELSM